MPLSHYQPSSSSLEIKGQKKKKNTFFQRFAKDLLLLIMLTKYITKNYIFERLSCQSIKFIWLISLLFCYAYVLYFECISSATVFNPLLDVDFHHPAYSAFVMQLTLAIFPIFTLHLYPQSSSWSFHTTVGCLLAMCPEFISILTVSLS